MTLVETFNTSDYNQMAATMGMAADSKPSRDSSTLARLITPLSWVSKRLMVRR
jgi:hypothetical protein